MTRTLHRIKHLVLAVVVAECAWLIWVNESSDRAPATVAAPAELQELSLEPNRLHVDPMVQPAGVFDAAAPALLGPLTLQTEVEDEEDAAEGEDANEEQQAAASIPLPKPTSLTIVATGGSTTVKVGTRYYSRDGGLTVEVSLPATATGLEEWSVALYRMSPSGEIEVGKADAPIAESGKWTINASGLPDGTHRLVARVEQEGQPPSSFSSSVEVTVMTGGPEIIAFSPASRNFAPGRMTATIYFDRDHPLDPNVAKSASSFALVQQDGKTSGGTIAGAVYDKNENAVKLTTDDTGTEGKFYLVVKPDLKDLAGSSVSSDSDAAPVVQLEAGLGVEVTRSRIAGVPAVRGVNATTGPYVRFKEYTNPRDVPEGFNPSDKVETRVARLYYYRDAHRVAQIINRKSRSYNREAVTVAQQLADDARGQADTATTERRFSEAQAIEAARKTREAENRVENLQRSLAEAARDSQANTNEASRIEDDIRARRRQDPPVDTGELEEELGDARQNAENSRTVVQSLAAQLEGAQASLQNLRDDEVRTSETLLRANEKEERLRAEQFRREVAAAHADPDTYAPGKPTSHDPVEQVSVSVIGEGLIQLRGPLKGVNIIRRMINEIDAPVGQVRVAIHTLQVNGEEANKMEKSVGDIQRSIDQARFLTLQTAEMLRKSVAQVAARRAIEVNGNYPGATQAERDMRYLHAFFGRDFINELRAIDSEFLHTGNKVLSLHSMDSTSLANALFIMALAKNDTRLEILQMFDALLQTELPRTEQSYLDSTFACIKKDCSEKLQSLGRCSRECAYCPLAGNARFETLRGFFNADIAGAETMTPVQREFVRLAQIFKSRLVTELEYKQRVVERAIIEERTGQSSADYRQRLQEAISADRQADRKRRDAVAKVAAGRADAAKKLFLFLRDVQPLLYEIRSQISIIKDDREAIDKAGGYAKLAGGLPYQIEGNVKRAYDFVENFNYSENRKRQFQELYYLHKKKGDDASNIRRRLELMFELLGHVDREAAELQRRVQMLAAEFDNLNRTPIELFNLTIALQGEIVSNFWRATKEDLEKAKLASTLPTSSTINEYFDDVNDALEKLLEANRDAQVAQREANLLRRPLDHKKFLDMLVDDLEDKYIELLEGTRAHTANIDNYIKRLSTALEDDYNTQFYFPTFRMVRQAGRYRDVTFGQIETTSILANNRELGKVSPQATMEFDLPKRDILITEALKGAKAAVDEYGALLNDPTFLSLAKMGSGAPTSSPLGGGSAGFSSVRDVLPGLDSSTQEQILSQNGPGDTQIGAAFESLIPDPAIYKFETGTGYEIRPVVQPDGQAVVFDFNYMYTTNVREPVRADEKHLGRVKRHFIDTDVQLSNYELREISRYQVQLKASRTGRGVPLLEDVPIVGALFRPLPQAESSLQQNLILGQTVIYPTLFDLMGLRWAPAVADLDPLRLSNEEFLVRGRHRALQNRVYDHASSQVDDFLRVPESMRRPDLYRTQESIPVRHPNGYRGLGLDRTESRLQEGYQPDRAGAEQRYYPAESPEGTPYRMPSPELPPGANVEPYPLQHQQETYERLQIPGGFE